MRSNRRRFARARRAARREFVLRQEVYLRMLREEWAPRIETAIEKSRKAIASNMAKPDWKRGDRVVPGGVRGMS